VKTNPELVQMGIAMGWLTMPQPHQPTMEDVERERNRQRMRKIRSGQRDIRRRDLARRNARKT